MSEFQELKTAPPDAIFLVKQKHDNDPFEKKVDVGIGAYRDDSGKPYILKAVKEAEKRIINENHEYLGISGLASFIECSRKLAFGEKCKSLELGQVASVQSLSGTGALRLGMEIIKQTFGTDREILISSPTWGNHRDIATRTGLKFKNYRYWKQGTRGLDFEGMKEDLLSAAEGSVVLLHMCAHNPTGVDPSEAQWRELMQICKKKKLLPFFDSAYQGFATGDCDRDAFPLRLFEQEGLELLLAQSFAKNFGLYGERVGCLSVVCKTKSAATAVESHLKKIIRAMYSNPPKHGALIVSTILSDKKLKQLWLEELKMISNRICEMRAALRKRLEETGTPGDWSFVTDQIGMFTFTGLNATQVEALEKEFHIYLPSNGRISIAGLNSSNVNYVADAIRSVL